MRKIRQDNSDKRDMTDKIGIKKAERNKDLENNVKNPVQNQTKENIKKDRTLQKAVDEIVRESIDTHLTHDDNFIKEKFECMNGSLRMIGPVNKCQEDDFG
jgi:hypothetical protein